MKRLLPFPVLVLIAAGIPAACAPMTSTSTAGSGPESAAAGPVAEAPSVENAPDRHREVHWVRTAAEYRALALQAYRVAWEKVQEHATGLEAGSWAVIMDADETVLDNSEFERRIAETGTPFEEPMWDAWVMEEAAELVSGAGEFIERVQSAGGRVAIVTNRDERLCPATRRNLAELGVRPAVVLCETDTGEKEPRFRMVREGTASDTLPPLEIVAWLGDNIGDFPGLEQSDRTGPAERFELFGERYFVLPNPMYGSWMGNDWW